MAFSHPELLVPSILALICALYPLPWHLRNRNIATLSIIFWMTSLNLVHIVNSVVWANDADIRSPAWCDISVLINIMYNYGLPLSHLILSRQIEGCTSLRMDSPLYSSITRRRGKIIDLSLALAGPVVGFLVSLSARASRFDVLEAYGPMPGVYWDTWGIVWVAVVPMSIAALCLMYTCRACYNIYKRRREMLSIISSNASVGKTDFIRLLVLAIAELGTCMLRAAFNMTWGTRGLARLAASSPEDRAPKSMTIIRTFPLERFSKAGRMTQNPSWLTFVACSMVFFLCFATSHETKRFYWGILEAIFPCIKTRRMARERQQGDRSPYTPFPTGSTTAAPVAGATNTEEDRKDLSFTELLVIEMRGSEISGASKVTLV